MPSAANSSTSARTRASAAPIAHDLMTYALSRNSNGTGVPIGTQISDEDAPG